MQLAVVWDKYVKPHYVLISPLAVVVFCKQFPHDASITNLVIHILVTKTDCLN